MTRVNYHLRVVAAILFGFSHPEQPIWKCTVCYVIYTAATAETQRRHSGQTFAHVQRCNDHKQRNGTNAPYPPNKWPHYAAVLVYQLAIMVDVLLGTMRSQTSYHQPHKPIIHGVLKAYNLCRWAQNRMVSQQGYPYLNKLHVQKVWSFSFPWICFLYLLLNRRKAT